MSGTAPSGRWCSSSLIVTWTARHPAHGVEDEHGELRAELIVRQVHASDDVAERGVLAHVAWLSLIQRQGEDIILASLAGVELGMPLHELPMDRLHRSFQRVLHPASGSGTRSRSRTTAPVKVKPVVPVISTCA